MHPPSSHWNGAAYSYAPPPWSAGAACAHEDPRYSQSGGAWRRARSPAVSHHLKLLKSADLIVSRRDGKEVYYTAANTEEAQKLHEMIETFVEMNCPLEGGR